MYALALSMLLCAGCGPATDDDLPGEIDTDRTAPRDSDSDSDSDSDTDSDTDGDTDTWLQAAGAYLGTTAMTLCLPTGVVSCDDGLFELSVHGDGSAQGWAGCDDQASGGIGSVTGQVTQGVFEGAWIVEIMMGRHQLPLPLAGTVADGHVLLELDFEDEWMSIAVRMEGWREE